MRETQESIAAWAQEAFGPAPSVERVLARAIEEAAELIRAITSEQPISDIAAEIADVTIVLARAGEITGVALPLANAVLAEPHGVRPLILACNAATRLLGEAASGGGGDYHLSACQLWLNTLAAVLGIDLDAEVDRKMAINRSRVWGCDGTGHGYHVRDKAAAP